MFNTCPLGLLVFNTVSTPEFIALALTGGLLVALGMIAAAWSNRRG